MILSFSTRRQIRTDRISASDFHRREEAEIRLDKDRRWTSTISSIKTTSLYINCKERIQRRIISTQWFSSRHENCWLLERSLKLVSRYQWIVSIRRFESVLMKFSIKKLVSISIFIKRSSTFLFFFFQPI